VLIDSNEIYFLETIHLPSFEYLTMLHLFSADPEWKTKILNGLFRGRRANMLAHNNKIKKKERKKNNAKNISEYILKETNKTIYFQRQTVI